jgi:prevent-host-death family protein
VTICGYVMAMTTVRIAELKAGLSRYLRQVRRGHVVTVMDRETPIAQIVPHRQGSDRLNVRLPLPSAPPLCRVPLPPPLKIDVDAVVLLLEERQGGR